MLLSQVIKAIDVWHEWEDSYAFYVPRFIQEAKSKLAWQDWDKDIFEEYFETGKNQTVSSLSQGYFSNAEKAKIKDNWQHISPLLKQIAESQHLPLFDVYEKIKNEVLKHTDTNKSAAVNRMIAGLQPDLLCTIITHRHLNDLYSLLKSKCLIDVPDYHFENWFKGSHGMYNFFKREMPGYSTYKRTTYPWQVLEFLRSGSQLNNLTPSNTSDMEITSLLKFKKQIILQGPPGTGKTRLAREIAREMLGIGPVPKKISAEEIVASLKEGTVLSSVYNEVKYTIVKINQSSETITAQKTSGAEKDFSFQSIIKAYEAEGWRRPEVYNADRRAAAAAKYIFEHTNSKADITNSEQFEIVQFHPSYSYEDFVRGIVARPNEGGEGVLYKAENKVMGSFALKAYNNYLASRSERQIHSAFEFRLSNLLEKIRLKLEDGQEFSFGDDSTAKIIAIKEDGLIYNFPKREDIRYKVTFTDLEKVYNVRHELLKPIDLRDKEKELGLTMKGKYPYYFMLLLQLNEILVPEVDKSAQPLKNYVLVIDEINRANLSSVLGELIYSLEYRGEGMGSMYDVDGSDILLPPNLYIIGTMNTADRSVGHIDYAIRRRFAFVDVLPEKLQETDEIYFNAEGFDKVAALFTEKNVSREFESKDVQIGHSYFIVKNEDLKDGKDKQALFDMKMSYEVVPILLEYVKDGILVGNVGSKSVKSYIVEDIKSK